MILPTNGGIVVIDDVPAEGQPLIDALSARGHLAALFDSRPELLPHSPLQGIRVVFLDLFLTAASQSTQTRISTILHVMNKTIDKKRNGPFFLVIWTTHGEEAEMVEGALRKDGFSLVASMITKDECKKDGGKFDIRLIHERMDAVFQKNTALQVLMLWENHVRSATGDIVNNLLSFDVQGVDLNKQLEIIISKLAKSILGQHFDRNDPALAIESAMYSLNSALTGTMHQQTRRSAEIEKLRINLCPDNNSTLLDGQINSALLLMPTNTRHIAPGNIYANTVQTVDLDDIVHDSTKLGDISHDIKHIMLEVTPVCDYAEKKFVKNRILPGVVFPDAHFKKLKRAEFLAISPVLAKDGNTFRFVFDFRLFTSIDSKQMPQEAPMFVMQNDLLFDIQTKLSKHMSRIGVASV